VKAPDRCAGLVGVTACMRLRVGDAVRVEAG
jgi:hypothetical protein